MPLTLYAGKVKFAAQAPRETQYGPRINAVITITQTGEEVKFWGNPESAIAHLKRGEEVSLSLSDKGKWELVGFAEPPQQTPTRQQQASQASQDQVQTPTRQQQAIDAPCDRDVQEWAWLYTQLKVALPDASEVTWRSGASTLYIARTKMAQCLLGQEGQ